MGSEIMTFKIRDGAEREDEAALAGFLRTVEVKKIDTAYADGAWRILVMFEELRRREETLQIRSAIVAALNQWRTQAGRALGLEREAVLPEPALGEIARVAPTTEIELNALASALGLDLVQHGAAIVQVVRRTLDDLTDGA